MMWALCLVQISFFLLKLPITAITHARMNLFYMRGIRMGTWGGIGKKCEKRDQVIKRWDRRNPIRLNLLNLEGIIVISRLVYR